MPETREELIQRITKEVLAVLAAQKTPPAFPRQNGVNVLVVGDPRMLPAYLLEGCDLAVIEDYEKDSDISKYEKIYIASLTFTELCDIALCRDSRPVQCAVIGALLSGKEVLLLESGLPHRAFAATASSAIYTLLEGYVRTIIGFGIKLVSDKAPIKLTKKVTTTNYMANGQDKRKANVARLITERMAMDLVKEGGPVQVSKNTILTPSAKDVLLSAGVEIVRES